MDIGGFEDDETEQFLSRLAKTQKGLGNCGEGDKLSVAKDSDIHIAFGAKISGALKKNNTQADDDDCDALWGMFGVDDMDIEEKPKSKPAKAKPFVGESASLTSNAGGLTSSTNLDQPLGRLEGLSGVSSPTSVEKAASHGGTAAMLASVDEHPTAKHVSIQGCTMAATSHDNPQQTSHLAGISESPAIEREAARLAEIQEPKEGDSTREKWHPDMIRTMTKPPEEKAIPCSGLRPQECNEIQEVFAPVLERSKSPSVKPKPISVADHIDKVQNATVELQHEGQVIQAVAKADCSGSRPAAAEEVQLEHYHGGGVGGDEAKEMRPCKVGAPQHEAAEDVGLPVEKADGKASGNQGSKCNGQVNEKPDALHQPSADIDPSVQAVECDKHASELQDNRQDHRQGSDQVDDSRGSANDAEVEHLGRTGECDERCPLSSKVIPDILKQPGGLPEAQEEDGKEDQLHLSASLAVDEQISTEAKGPSRGTDGISFPTSSFVKRRANSSSTPAPHPDSKMQGVSSDTPVGTEKQKATPDHQPPDQAEDLQRMVKTAKTSGSLSFRKSFLPTAESQQSLSTDERQSLLEWKPNLRQRQASVGLKNDLPMHSLAATTLPPLGNLFGRMEDATPAKVQEECMNDARVGHMAANPKDQKALALMDRPFLSSMRNVQREATHNGEGPRTEHTKVPPVKHYPEAKPASATPACGAQGMGNSRASPQPQPAEMPPKAKPPSGPTEEQPGYAFAKPHRRKRQSEASPAASPLAGLQQRAKQQKLSRANEVRGEGPWPAKNAEHLGRSKVGRSPSVGLEKPVKGRTSSTRDTGPSLPTLKPTTKLTKQEPAPRADAATVKGEEESCKYGSRTQKTSRPKSRPPFSKGPSNEQGASRPRISAFQQSPLPPEGAKAGRAVPGAGEKNNPIDEGRLHQTTSDAQLNMLSGEYYELMAKAREELCRSEGQAQLVQRLNARIDRMSLELDEMQGKILELRVQAAITANRLIRLDNPIVFSKMDALKDEILEKVREP